MVDPTSRTVGKAIHNNNLATLQGSKERSAWVSHMAMAIMASRTVENAMHFQSNNQPFFVLFCSLVDILSSFVVSVVVVLPLSLYLLHSTVIDLLHIFYT